MNDMITVQDLAFSYTKNPFVEDISFTVGKGEIFGLLGPSGAGKSTIQKILVGLIREYRGSVIVNGVESRRHTKAFYQNIGMDFEFPSFYEKLTAAQNLEFFGSLYSNPLRDQKALLKEVGLLDAADKKVSGFSKGMKSRLNFIKALLHNPDILFLDEPTSGLDPNNARIMKDMILKEREKGKSIILTTHNMADATELCDEVAFIVDGHIKAKDTPHNLIMSRGAAKVTYSYMENGKEQTKSTLLSDTGSDEILHNLLKTNQLRSIHSSEPTLNDIFMEVTGRSLE